MNYLILLGYIFERCTRCLKKLKTKPVVKEWINGIAVEVEHRCIYCDSLESYEAYGADDRDYYAFLTMKEFPVLSKILVVIKKVCGTFKLG